MNKAFFSEFTKLFEEIRKDTTYRAVVVSARGKYFSVGLDLKQDSVDTNPEIDCVGNFLEVV